MRHQLKILPEYFDAIDSMAKEFEIRKDDRGFAVGDTLELSEHDGGEYTGRRMIVSVTYITDFGQSPGYVAMGIKVRSGFIYQGGQR